MIESDPEQDDPTKEEVISDKMKIAFRYQNLSACTIDGSTKNKHIGHYFDLSKNISFSDIENTDIYYWTGQRIETGTL